MIWHFFIDKLNVCNHANLCGSDSFNMAAFNFSCNSVRLASGAVSSQIQRHKVGSCSA